MNASNLFRKKLIAVRSTTKMELIGQIDMKKIGIARWCLYCLGLLNFLIFAFAALVFAGMLGFATNLSPDSFFDTVNLLPTLLFTLYLFVLIFGSIFHVVIGKKLTTFKRWVYNAALVLFALNLMSPLFPLSIVGLVCLLSKDVSTRIDSAQ